jgi:hypothetical protein
MILIFYIFSGIMSFIGTFVFFTWLSLLLKEILRAAKQSHRVASIVIRTKLNERRPPTLKEWGSCFLDDLFKSYDSLEISYITIPYNPKNPIRSALKKNIVNFIKINII